MLDVDRDNISLGLPVGQERRPRLEPGLRFAWRLRDPNINVAYSGQVQGIRVEKDRKKRRVLIDVNLGGKPYNLSWETFLNGGNEFFLLEYQE